MSTLVSVLEPKSQTVTLPVRCRPDQLPWLVIIVFSVVFSVCFCLIGARLTALPSGFWFAVGVWVAICLGSPLSLGIWMARAAVVADEDGLRWRGIGRWQHATWDEVTAYYQQIWSTGAQERTVSVVECGTRRLYFSKGMSGEANCLRLQRAISKYAVNAHASEWQVLGTRPNLDWPRVFRYDTRANRWKVHQVSICLTLITVLLFFPSHVTYTTLWWKAISLTSVLASVSWLSFKMFVIWRVKQAAHRRFDEQITVTQEGFCWQKQDISVSAAWNEITDYFRVSQPKTAVLQRIVTSQGNIDFHLSIQDFAVLKQIIVQQAGQAKTKAWRKVKVSEALDGVSSQWSSGLEGIGERIYNYRTRTNRALLRLMAVFILIPWIVSAFLGPFAKPMTPTDLLEMVALTVISGALLFWCWYRYRAASVRTSADGITQYALFGKKYIAWKDVLHVYISGDGKESAEPSCLFGNIISPNARIRFWLGIADVEELKEEIARRAVHATGNWQGQISQDFQETMRDTRIYEVK